MLELVSGDLLAAPGLDAIAHGCNCAGKMGAGIALPIRQRWPAMFEEYRRRCLAGTFQLGDVFPWRAPDLVIFNLATQPTPGRSATLTAIETSVRAMLLAATDLGVHRIGLPRIGAGLGGLRWEAVRPLLERLATDTPHTLVVFEHYVPAKP